jgi:hypothetical protein
MWVRQVLPKELELGGRIGLTDIEPKYVSTRASDLDLRKAGCGPRSARECAFR